VACRTDGGTFLLMLPHTGERGKMGAAGRVLRAIGEIEMRTRSGRAQPSASAGVAVYPLDGDSKDELIDAAMSGLALAKIAGGGRAASERDRQ
jgi:PleD family two-component response regulator